MREELPRVNLTCLDRCRRNGACRTSVLGQLHVDKARHDATGLNEPVHNEERVRPIGKVRLISDVRAPAGTVVEQHVLTFGKFRIRPTGVNQSIPNVYGQIGARLINCGVAEDIREYVLVVTGPRDPLQEPRVSGLAAPIVPVDDRETLLGECKRRRRRQGVDMRRLGNRVQTNWGRLRRRRR